MDAGATCDLLRRPPEPAHPAPPYHPRCPPRRRRPPPVAPARLPHRPESRPLRRPPGDLRVSPARGPAVHLHGNPGGLRPLGGVARGDRPAPRGLLGDPGRGQHGGPAVRPGGPRGRRVRPPDVPRRGDLPPERPDHAPEAGRGPPRPRGRRGTPPTGPTAANPDRAGRCEVPV